MIDLTPYVHRDKPFFTVNNNIDVFMTIDKCMYDAIRTNKDTLLLDGNEYNLIEFNTNRFHYPITNYIGLGKEFDIHISIVLEETKSSIRNKKIKELGL
jgi:hypothetical protein